MKKARIIIEDEKGNILNEQSYELGNENELNNLWKIEAKVFSMRQQLLTDITKNLLEMAQESHKKKRN